MNNYATYEYNFSMKFVFFFLLLLSIKGAHRDCTATIGAQMALDLLGLGLGIPHQPQYEHSQSEPSSEPQVLATKVSTWQSDNNI